MKVGKILLKIGKKISGKKENNKGKELTVSAKSDDKDDWPCWWLFNKPRKPRCFK